MNPWGEADRRTLRWAPLLVPLASLTGLGTGMHLIGLVWIANLWADLIFIVGTLAAILLTLRAGEHARGFTWFIAPLLHLMVYLASAPLMLGNAGDLADWTPARFFLPLVHEAPALRLVFIVGWPGLVVHALVGLAFDIRGTGPRP